MSLKELEHQKTKSLEDLSKGIDKEKKKEEVVGSDNHLQNML